MRLLAIDTASAQCSAALWIDGDVRFRAVATAREHARLLLPMIESLLAEGGIGFAALDGIAFGRGPGSFTGLRVAASVAQGMALGASLPVVPVSDLAAVAQRVIQEDTAWDEILVVNDARMREVYWARFPVRSHLVSMECAERVDPPSAVPVNAPAGRWAAAGRGLSAWPDLAEACATAGATLFPELLPRASEVLALARPQVAEGQILDPTQALPVYVRDRVAEPAR